MPDEVMTPVPKAEAISLAEIHAMRSLADAVSGQTKAFEQAMSANTKVLEKLSDKVDGINSRLIRLEEAKHGREIDALKAEIAGIAERVDGLEQIRDRQAGAMGVGAWVTKYAPWLMALIVSGLAAVGWRGNS